MGQSHYLIIKGGMVHLGDQPASIEGAVGNFVGQIYYANFKLPENLDQNEGAVMQFRYVQDSSSKKLIINSCKLGKLFKPQSNGNGEWSIDTSVIPENCLQPGENTMYIGHAISTPSDYGDFIIDDIILWYKTK